MIPKKSKNSIHASVWICGTRTVVVFLLIFSVGAFFSSSYCQEADDGNSKLRDPVDFFSSPPDLGNIESTVNKFTGDVALNVPLVNLIGKHGHNLSVSLQYSSNIHKTINSRNRHRQANWTGLGWSLAFGGYPDKIVSDHNNTKDITDDRYFLAGEKLVYSTSPEAGIAWYKPQGNLFVRAVRYYDESLAIVNKWVLVLSDGTQCEFGATADSRENLLAWGNWSGPSNKDPSSVFCVVWHLNKIVDPRGNSILIEYDQDAQPVNSNPGSLKYTRSIYPKKITDTMGRTVNFSRNGRSSDEFQDFYQRAVEPDAHMEKFEIDYLDELEVRDSYGSVLYSYDFIYTADPGTGSHFRPSGINPAVEALYTKRQLLEIELSDKDGNPQPKYYFSYAQTGQTNEGALTELIYPTGARVKFQYYKETSINQLSQGGLHRRIDDVYPQGISGEIWISASYAVILNRIGSSIDVFAYYWTGLGWEGSSLPIHNITNADQEDFDHSVLMGDGFFVVNRNSGDNDDDEAVFLFHWDEVSRVWVNSNNWETDKKRIEVAVGKNYVTAIHQDGGTMFRRLFTGVDWQNHDVSYPSGNYRLYGHNDYFVLADRSGSIDLIYRQWVKDAGFSVSDALQIPNDGHKVTHCGDFFLVSMEDNGDEYVYRWDADGSTWLSADLTISGVLNLDPVYTSGPAFIVNDSDGPDWVEAYRFNGETWVRRDYSVDWTYANTQLGNDYLVIRDHSGTSGYINAFNYDSDANSWPASSSIGYLLNGDIRRSVAAQYDIIAFNNDEPGQNHISASFLLKPSPSGWWDQRDLAISNNEPRLPYSSGDFVLYQGGTPHVVETRIFDHKLDIYQNAVTLASGTGLGIGYYNSLAVSTPGAVDPYTDLYRVLDDQYTGNLSDYNVQNVYVSPDGDETYESRWLFDFENGRFDPSGEVCTYNKSIIYYPGQSGSYNGKKETFLFNGLSNVEVGNTFPVDDFGSNMATTYTRMTGQPYLIETYELDGGSYSLVETSVNYYDCRLVSNSTYWTRLVGNERKTHKSGLTKTMTTTYEYDALWRVPAPVEINVQEDENPTIRSSYSEYVATDLELGAIYDKARELNMLNLPSKEYIIVSSEYQSFSWAVYDAVQFNGIETLAPIKERTWLADNPSTSEPIFSETYPGTDFVFDAVGNLIEAKDNGSGKSVTSVYIANTLPVAIFDNATIQGVGGLKTGADEFGDLSIGDGTPCIWQNVGGNWSVTNNSSSIGELVVEPVGNSNGLNSANSYDLTDFVVEFDLRLAEDGDYPNNYAGFTFRKTSSSHTTGSGYMVYLRSTGEIGLREGAEVHTEVPSGLLSLQAHIKIFGSGDEMVVFVEGRKLLTVIDGTYSNGVYLGFFSPGIRAYFDNFVIYPKGATYSLTSYDASTLNVLERIDTNGSKISYRYDSLGRLTKVIGPDGAALKEVGHKYSSEQ